MKNNITGDVNAKSVFNKIKVFKNFTLDDLEVACLAVKSLKKKIILLYGNLGSGKTEFVKRYLKNDIVSSPSYFLYNEYKINDKEIIHFDLYIKNVNKHDFFFFAENNDIVFVEWARFLRKELIMQFANQICKVYMQNKKIKLLYQEI